MERKFLNYRKTCPFLFNNFRIDVSKNRVALDFLLKFKSLCPYLYHRSLMKKSEMIQKEYPARLIVPEKINEPHHTIINLS